MSDDLGEHFGPDRETDIPGPAPWRYDDGPPRGERLRAALAVGIVAVIVALCLLPALLAWAIGGRR